MSRFFVGPDQIDAQGSGGTVRFEGPDAHHIHAVLRLAPGQTVWALDGAGCEYEAVLCEVGRKSALARITAKRLLDTEPSVRITVAQALPKTLDKLEWVLQHATEIGAAGFLVFESERGRSGEQLARKLARWQEIVRSAAEQSHRALLPCVEGIVPFSEMLAQAHNFDLCLLAYEGERNSSLVQALAAQGGSQILIVIGPEGGFTGDEVKSAQEAGIFPVTLGPRILRTETAGLAMVSQILALRESGQACT